MLSNPYWNTRPKTKKDLLKMIEAARTIHYSEKLIPLSHLGNSNFYVEAREEVTDRPIYANSLLQPIFHQVFQREDHRFPIAIGIPFSGNMLAGCMQGMHGTANALIGCRLTRSQKKDHGNTDGLLPTPDHDSHWYFTIDNTISSGGSFLKAMKQMESLGYETKEMLHCFLFDRGLGGLEHLQRKGYKVFAAYHVPTIIRTFVELDLWPQERLALLEQEIESMKV
ncbi:MAG: hypothetical protein AAGA35_04370 [Patescibacteria group bacterium]